MIMPTYHLAGVPLQRLVTMTTKRAATWSSGTLAWSLNFPLDPPSSFPLPHWSTPTLQFRRRSGTIPLHSIQLAGHSRGLIMGFKGRWVLCMSVGGGVAGGSQRSLWSISVWSLTFFHHWWASIWTVIRLDLAVHTINCLRIHATVTR